ncbi:MAG: hypothetical protein Kow0074_23120 [Candidatus Zixiibacteriota bacterium]
MVYLAEDGVSQTPVFVKRLATTPQLNLSALRDQLTLLHTLAGSGFLDFEDVVRRDDAGAEVTFRHIETVSLSEIHAVGGDSAVLGVFRQISRAVAYLHSLDYLHGDLKPDNILLEMADSECHAYLVDLDLSVRRDVQLVRHIQGSAGFMAPEIGAGATLTESIDIYAFGRTVEMYLSDLRDTILTSGLRALADRCTSATVGQRPWSMWDILGELDAIGRSAGVVPAPDPLLPPLRPAGLALRVERLKQMIWDGGAPRAGVCVVDAPYGGGASRLLQELCLELQWERQTTLRLTDVSSLSALRQTLPALADGARRQHNETSSHSTLWILVHTTAIADVERAHWMALQEWARAESCVLLIEGHHLFAADIPEDCRVYHVPSLTPRECVIAAGHLTTDPAVTAANQDALPVATGGIPQLIRFAMRRSGDINRLRTIEEPVNMDGVDDATLQYWSMQYDVLHDDERDVLGTASVFHWWIPMNLLRHACPHAIAVDDRVASLSRRGWLVQEPNPDGGTRVRFVCRSARNAVRRRLGVDQIRRLARECLLLSRDVADSPAETLFSEWSLRGALGHVVSEDDRRRLRRGPGGPVDIKLVVWLMTRHYRVNRQGNARARLDWCGDIAIGYAALGSVRRQRMWIRRALALLDQLDDEERVSFDVIQLTNRLLEMSGDVEEWQRWLRRMNTALADGDGYTRGFVLGELSAIALLKLNGEKAAELAHTAIHLLERDAPECEAHIRSLNRCGLAYSHMGHLETSTKYLEESHRLARRHGFDHIEWRSIGNLGYVARAEGDPQRAYRYARAISQYYRITNEKILYVTGLRDQVLSLADMGRTTAALRAARLAAILARSVAGPLMYGNSLNNLGWILYMRGEADEAYRCLTDSIRIILQHNADHLTIWARQNLAWLYLAGQLSEQAERVCRDALALDVERGMQSMHVELWRILALTAIQMDQFDAAEAYLAEAERLAGHRMPKANAEIDSVRVELYLWCGELDKAGQMLDRMVNNPVFRRVHPLRLDAARHRGHYYMKRGDHPAADAILSRTAEECRLSNRYDKQIETLLLRARLAHAMGNRPMAIRLLDITREMINRIRGALNEPAL